jgi:penicillin amidase
MLQTVVDKTTLSDNEKSKLQLLTEWDFQYRAQSEAPVIFDIFYKKLSENTWDELIDLRKKMDLNLPESWRLLELIKTKPDHRFFDVKATAAHETAADVVNKSFKEAVAELEKRRSEGSKNTWGAYKPLDIHHLTRLPALSVTGLEADGCPDAINATGISFGPSWRMVVSLENEIKAYGVYPGGQSGNPGSRYYKNMIDPWMKGEYFPLNLMATREQLLRNKQQAITLNPVK